MGGSSNRAERTCARRKKEGPSVRPEKGIGSGTLLFESRRDRVMIRRRRQTTAFFPVVVVAGLAGHERSVLIVSLAVVAEERTALWGSFFHQK